MADEIANRKAYWESTTLKKATDRFPERRTEFRTLSGIAVRTLYAPDDLADYDYLRDLGFPGEYPYTRGVQPTMYRGRLWTMRQYAGFATAQESNQRYKYLLSQGQTGLSVAFDLPTQIGYDADHPLAEGEVGKVGVSVCSLADMEILFDGIPLDRVSTSMTINAPAAILLAMYIAAAEKQGVPASALRGTVQNDILKEYVARGTYIYPPHPSMRLITDVFAHCKEHLPKWNTISISGYHIREAGATAVQEVAFTLGNAIAYVEAAIRAGLEVDEFAPRLSFFFNAHNHLFEEVAKFRAARRIWARIIRERFGAQDPGSAHLRFHTQTAGSTLTAQQPDNNVVRVALQALSAVLGGTQSLHTNSRDEALCLPTAQSVQIALRTQQIIAHESGTADTVDPLAGSYYVEHLTDEIERQVMDYLQRIDALGGMLKAIEGGFVQREIQNSAYAYQKAVDSREQVVVGVNEFTVEEEQRYDMLRVDPAVEEEQRARLDRLRAERDSARVQDTLRALHAGAEGEDNLVPLILNCVRADATLGEICDVLRDVFGEYRPGFGL
ncbi:MAG: methylmalonyl-CoA mutase family protein [Anaerolineae bacterium]|nr:methylmalonyl-CoA mutase family protein [Anaerolineae bacterium]